MKRIYQRPSLAITDAQVERLCAGITVGSGGSKEMLSRKKNVGNTTDGTDRKTGIGKSLWED